MWLSWHVSSNQVSFAQFDKMRTCKWRIDHKDPTSNSCFQLPCRSDPYCTKSWTTCNFGQSLPPHLCTKWRNKAFVNRNPFLFFPRRCDRRGGMEFLDSDLSSGMFLNTIDECPCCDLCSCVIAFFVKFRVKFSKESKFCKLYFFKYCSWKW